MKKRIRYISLILILLSIIGIYLSPSIANQSSINELSRVDSKLFGFMYVSIHVKIAMILSILAFIGAIITRIKLVSNFKKIPRRFQLLIEVFINLSINNKKIYKNSLIDKFSKHKIRYISISFLLISFIGLILTSLIKNNEILNELKTTQLFNRINITPNIKLAFITSISLIILAILIRLFMIKNLRKLPINFVKFIFNRYFNKNSQSSTKLIIRRVSLLIIFSSILAIVFNFITLSIILIAGFILFRIILTLVIRNPFEKLKNSIIKYKTKENNKNRKKVKKIISKEKIIKNRIRYVSLTLILVSVIGLYLNFGSNKQNSINEFIQVNNIKLFGFIDITTSIIISTILTILLIIGAIIIRLKLIPKFKIVPGKLQLLIEEFIKASDGTKKGNIYKNSFIEKFLKHKIKYSSIILLIVSFIGLILTSLINNKTVINEIKTTKLLGYINITPNIKLAFISSLALIILAILFRLLMINRLRTLPIRFWNKLIKIILDKAPERAIKRKLRYIFLIVAVISFIGIIITPRVHHEILLNEAIKESVVHSSEKFNLFGILDVNPGMMSAFIVSGMLIFIAILIRVFAIPRFKLIPGKCQIVIEKIVQIFINLARTNSPHRNKFLGAYIFVAGIYISISTIFELFGVQMVSTNGTIVTLPAPLSDLNGAITMAIISFLVIMSGGIAEHGFKGILKTLKEFSLPISMSFRLFGALLSGLLVTDLVYHTIYLSFVLPVIVAILFTLLHALIQAYVLTMLTSIFYGEVSEKKIKKQKNKKIMEEKNE